MRDVNPPSGDDIRGALRLGRLRLSCLTCCGYGALRLIGWSTVGAAMASPYRLSMDQVDHRTLRREETKEAGRLGADPVASFLLAKGRNQARGLLGTTGLVAR
jgi:hypothetical protein